MNILITGIHGYVGSNLVKAFKDEHTIYGMDLITSDMEGVKQIVHFSDIKNLPDVDVVIHLAAKARETQNLSEALDYFEINAGMTRSLFHWFSQSTAKKFIFFSSVKAVTNNAHDLALTEDVEPTPFGALGESKLLAEKYILSQYVFNKKVYVLRPSIIIGRGGLGSKSMRAMYNCVQKGYPYVFGKFECCRSFTNMDNLTFVLKKMTETNIPSGVYNVTDDGFLTAKEIFEIMGSVLRKKATIWYLNKGFIRFVSKIGTRVHFVFDDYRYQKLTSNLIVSNEKLKKALGIKKMPVSTVDGVENAIRDYKV